MARQSERARESFEQDVLRVVRNAAAAVALDGRAQLVEGEDGGGPFLRLVPANLAACELAVYPDYPTLCMGGPHEAHCTEMFGSQESRLAELRQLVEAVIRGAYEWEHRQRVRRILGLALVRHTQLVGTFHTEAGPWTFNRQGGEPVNAVTHRTYEPY